MGRCPHPLFSYISSSTFPDPLLHKPSDLGLGFPPSMAAALTTALLLLLLSSSPFLALAHLSPSPSPSVAHPPSISLPPTPTSPSPDFPASPPAPPLHEGGDSPSPSPTPSPTPAPAPAPEAKGVVHNAADVDSADRGEKSSGGMSAGKKVGVAIGVIAAVAFVSLGVIVYRKRQENLQRARYGHNARMMEMI